MKKYILYSIFILLVLYGCQQVSQQKPMTNEDYRQLAIGSQDATVCQNIKDPVLQQKCAEDVSKAPLEISNIACVKQCEGYTNSYNNCIIQEAIKIKRPDLCDNIVDGVVREICAEEANK